MKLYLIIFIVFLTIIVGIACLHVSHPYSGRHCLWKVKYGKSTIYLMGDMELPKESIYPLPDVIEEAFDKSDILVLSADYQDYKKPEVKELLSYESPDSLLKYLKPETYTKIRSYFSQRGIKETDILFFKPYYISLVIDRMELRKYGVDTKYDLYFYFLEKKGKKRVDFMYNIKDTYRKLDSVFMQQPDEYMNLILDDKHSYHRFILLYEKYWEDGDILSLSILNEDYTKDYPTGIKASSKELKVEINKEALTKINRYFSTGKVYFIVINTIYLIGEDGLLNMLQKKVNVSIEQL